MCTKMPVSRLITFSLAEVSLIECILEKYHAEKDEELGQAQFAQLLHSVLQDIVEALNKKNVIVTQNVKIINGSMLRKLLANEKELNNMIEGIFNDLCKDKKGCPELLRRFLEKNRIKVGLPPSEANEAMVLLFDQVFADVGTADFADNFERDDLEVLVRDVLKKLEKLLEANPILHDLEN
ncbi:hypothetical protein GIB67_008560 [Kingdonia uniflora]|uniref:Uncharacterized protein n=1 Tax=Kingdonia uniflora TaxID=39325 RepID=A0A7J7N3L9_9MAGN|nr:hypothetical protein GIB67_008560 [Kingdonia uniflora]